MPHVLGSSVKKFGSLLKYVVIVVLVSKPVALSYIFKK